LNLNVSASRVTPCEPEAAERNNMKVADNAVPEPMTVGREMYGFVTELYPICRSITGDGVRETLRRIGQYIPLEIREVASGTEVFDWTVPKEWNIRDAYVKNAEGERIIDFRKSNLHVMSYSIPVRQTMSLGDLKTHLHTLPEHPDWIPYRTSYYKENWGFCLSHRQSLELKDEEYEVCIDASLEDGHLSYGECYLPGETTEEILISSHVCHPSLCNDNLSGISLAVAVAKRLKTISHRYSYRFLFAPATLGPIVWLAANEVQTERIKHGLILACVGDSGKTTYKKSRRGNAEVDWAVAHVLKHSGRDYHINEFSPWGYDERQYCSPGFNLPVGCLMRTPNGCFPEYHSSADNLAFVRAESLEDSFNKCVSILEVLENNYTYLNKNPKCEPRLGKRGLYRTIGGQAHATSDELSMLWVLNFSDGKHSLLEIAEKSGLPFPALRQAAEALREHHLLEVQSPPRR
jgi:aminopeptidase-like protein